MHFCLSCSRRIFQQPPVEIWDHKRSWPTHLTDCTLVLHDKHWPSSLFTPSSEAGFFEFPTWELESVSISLWRDEYFTFEYTLKKETSRCKGALVLSLESPPALLCLTETWLTNDGNLFYFHLHDVVNFSRSVFCEKVAVFCFKLGKIWL